MWDFWRGHTCPAGAETTKFPKLWNAGLGLLQNATTFYCSWINPEVCCFNMKTVPSNRAALLEMAKVKAGSSPSRLWPPGPPEGHRAEKTVDSPKINKDLWNTHCKTHEDCEPQTRPTPALTAELSPQGPTWLPCGCRDPATRPTPRETKPSGLGRHRTSGSSHGEVNCRHREAGVS